MRKTRASYEPCWPLNSSTTRQFFSLISRGSLDFSFPFFLPVISLHCFVRVFFSVSFLLALPFLDLFPRFWTITLVMRAIYYIKGYQGKKTGEFPFFRFIPSRIQKRECFHNGEKLNRLLSKVRGVASFNAEVLHSNRDSLELSLHKSVNREEIRGR